jgi:hypothetical protein
MTGLTPPGVPAPRIKRSLHCYPALYTLLRVGGERREEERREEGEMSREERGKR